MKQIVMLQGMGNNERGWARMVSKFGRVVLIQQGMIQHVEVWENEQCLFNGPETSVMSTRKLDEMTFSTLTIGRSLARVREFTKGKKLDVIIATNYSMGMAALFLRTFGKTKRAVVVLSDYLPIKGSPLVRLHRQASKWLTRLVAYCSDEVWTVSPRIPTATANPRNFVLPICLNDNHTPIGERNEVGYVGFPSADHALEVLFDICKRHGFRLNIIGNSAYLESIKSQAPPGTLFHGVLNDQDRINEIFSRCFCGYAVYRNTGPQSYSYFGIPSKTFHFLASNTPVVTTNTAHFTQTIEKFGLGRVVEPKLDEIESAVLEIRHDFKEFYEAINRFRKDWNAGVERFHRERLTVLETGINLHHPQ